jgi:hypothetical protein
MPVPGGGGNVTLADQGQDVSGVSGDGGQLCVDARGIVGCRPA